MEFYNWKKWKRESFGKPNRKIKKEIEDIKKFIAEDGFSKKIEEANATLEELSNIEIGELRGKPTLVDFWADWCQPCHMISSVVDELKEKYMDTLNVTQVDTETEIGNELYKNYAVPCGVNAIPYLIVFDKDGNFFDSVIGADPNKLTQIVEAALNQ